MNSQHVNDDSSASGYLTTDYEGLSATFSEVEQLPATGYCELYRAKRYGRWYLLKCLTAEHEDDEAYRQILRKELEVLMSLQHPAVMQAVGMEPVVLPGRGEVACLVAEWIDGMTLSDFLRQQPASATLRRIAAELADAVAYVHQQQVVHRDLKPSNIMITHNGHYAKLIDFGLADTDSHAILKQPAGTLRYMAPEQAQLAQADVRNDIYSLGVIFQEMNQLGGARIPERIVSRCLAPIDHRYQEMSQLTAALERSRHRRRRLLIAAITAVVLFVVAVMGWQVLLLQRKAETIQGDADRMNRQLRVLRHEIIDFDDPAVHRKCLAHWDIDRDGELSYDEVCAVTSLDSVFTRDTTIMFFPELQYFTGLNDISPGAFRDCSRLQSVTLPRTIRFFRRDAFRGSGLRMLTVPSTVVGIGDHCMDDMPELQTVVFEAQMPATNEGVVPLQGCPRLSSIYIPKYMMARLDDRRSWESLRPLMQTNIRFADPEVKAICLRHWDKSGDGELQIDEAQAVTALDAAFTNNPAITSFDELRYFTGLTAIGSSEFDECRHLRSIQLPATILSIGAWAFHLCYSLDSITLPDRLEHIGHNAFDQCPLRSIFIPASVTSLTSTSVSACPQLRRVVVSPDNPVYDSRDGCNAIIETATNMLLSGSAAAYIPRSVTSLSDEAFNYFHPDTLTIPRQITRIGPWTLAANIGCLYMESPVPPAFDSQNGQVILGQTTDSIFVPRGSLRAYLQAEGFRQCSKKLHEYTPK